MRRASLLRSLVLVAYGAALLLASGWHEHHEEESAEEHRSHIVGSASHEGLHVDSLPAHHADHHPPDCLSCGLLSQAPLSTADSPFDGDEKVVEPARAEARVVLCSWSRPSRVRGPPTV